MNAPSHQRVLLTGGSGQLGYECQLAAPSDVEAVAPARSVLDLADPTSIRACVQEVQPALILHCGVDRATKPAFTADRPVT